MNEAGVPGADPFGDPGYAPFQTGVGPDYGSAGNGFASAYGTAQYGTLGRYGASMYPYSATPGATYLGATRYGQGVGMLGRADVAGSAALLGLSEAMQRFARISSILEEVLRNFHMLLDGIFGLGYNLSMFSEEVKAWLTLKVGPGAVIARLLRRAAHYWRQICAFFCSPLAGRFSPVALVLQILGLAPLDHPTSSMSASVPAAGVASSRDGAQGSEFEESFARSRAWRENVSSGGAEERSHL